MCFDLVVFDCDGVLVDSEKITNSVFCEMLRELGASVTLSDMFERFVGQSSLQCSDIISEIIGNETPENFFDEFQKIYPRID